MSNALRAELTPVDERHLRAVCQAHDITEGVAVIGIRGYNKQFAKAETGGNLHGVYDDAICLVTPTAVHTFAGNTDPSSLIQGRAVLEAGRYRYIRGIHGVTREKAKQYPAWVQAGGVNIRRHDAASGKMGPVLKSQWIGCNIHKGGWATTGSAACQTVVPEQWAAFDSKLDAALRAAAQVKFWYVLTL